MQKAVLWISSVLLSTYVVAGGDTSKVLTPVVEIPTLTNKSDTVYIEDDAQLMWQDQRYSNHENGAFKQNKSIGKAGSFSHAQAYCNVLEYDGFGDWRLPTSDELQHVHRKHGQVFTYFRDTDFWTSTPASRGRYYVVYPADAYIYEQEKGRTNYIRCVRSLKN